MPGLLGSPPPPVYLDSTGSYLCRQYIYEQDNWTPRAERFSGSYCQHITMTENIQGTIFLLFGRGTIIFSGLMRFWAC